MNLETESDFSVCLLMKVLEKRGGKNRYRCFKDCCFAMIGFCLL